MPRIVDHDQRRREICDVLLDVVADHGIPAVTIRGVARRGGWSTGVISHYFKSRQDLLLGGLRRAAEHLDDYNRKVLTTLEGIAAIEHLLEGSIPIDGRRVALCRIFFFFYNEAMHQEEIKKEIESYLAGWRSSVAKAIRQSQRKGDFPENLDSRQAATDLIGLADGISMHALLDTNAMERIRENSPIRFWLQNLSREAKMKQLSSPLAQ